MPNLFLVDYVFLAILLVMFIHGYKRGFALELATLIAFLVAGALAMFVTNAVGGGFASTASGAGGSEVVGEYKPIMAFMFGGIFACGVVFGLFIVRKMAGSTGVMGFGNCLLGGIMGLLCGATVILAVIACLQYTAFRSDDNWQGSMAVNALVPYVEIVAETLNYSHLASRE